MSVAAPALVSTKSPVISIRIDAIDYQLIGRVAEIVAEIVAYSERINAMDAGSVEFHCGPSGQVKPYIHEALAGRRGRGY